MNDDKTHTKPGDVDRSSGILKSNPVSTGDGKGRTWIVGGKVNSIKLKKLAPTVH